MVRLRNSGRTIQAKFANRTPGQGRPHLYPYWRDIFLGTLEKADVPANVVSVVMM